MATANQQSVERNREHIAASEVSELDLARTGPATPGGGSCDEGLPGKKWSRPLAEELPTLGF
jgi:hypothetical protein